MMAAVHDEEMEDLDDEQIAVISPATSGLLAEDSDDCEAAGNLGTTAASIVTTTRSFQDDPSKSPSSGILEDDDHMYDDDEFDDDDLAALRRYHLPTTTSSPSACTNATTTTGSWKEQWTEFRTAARHRRAVRLLEQEEGESSWMNVIKVATGGIPLLFVLVWWQPAIWLWGTGAVVGVWALILRLQARSTSDFRYATRSRSGSSSSHLHHYHHPLQQQDQERQRQEEQGRSEVTNGGSVTEMGNFRDDDDHDDSGNGEVV